MTKTNSSDEGARELPRRSFLKAAGLAGVAAAAAVVPKAEAEAAEPTAGDAKGYRETDHVRAYYETAKF